MGRPAVVAVVALALIIGAVVVFVVAVVGKIVVFVAEMQDELIGRNARVGHLDGSSDDVLDTRQRVADIRTHQAPAGYAHESVIQRVAVAAARIDEAFPRAAGPEMAARLHASVAIDIHRVVQRKHDF